MQKKSSWLKYTVEQRDFLEGLSRDYRAFLDAGKTERECVAEAVEQAEKRGFVNLEARLKSPGALKPGEKIYVNCMDKSLALFVTGKRPLEEGLNVIAAHIDSPRLDAKPNPIGEEEGICYLDTHYYGGIKKYQWLAMPLAMHGVAVRKDGSRVNIVVGEDEDDPVLGISDLLPHLDHEQDGKKVSDAFKGEKLDVILASAPLKDVEKDAVKESLLKILEDKYAIREEDLLSSEIEIVPAGKARDFGLDRSMIIAYGHDDRCCSYPSMRALFDLDEIPEKTCVCILTDKEEIGSVGASGMRASYFTNAVAELIAMQTQFTEIKLRRALANGNVLSCDVSAAFDPKYPEPFEKKNAAFLGHGLALSKYTGSRGKSGSNDASCEYIASLRSIFDEAGADYQLCEMGAVDAGGGGTIAYILALYGMNVIDAGLAVLSMHAPWEIISKADLYESYTAYKAFLINA
ncbi:MAG: aminopeptidase [Clostridia bacterium]|nr:aminopeptidase [Clostridia bacterium]